MFLFSSRKMSPLHLVGMIILVIAHQAHTYSPQAINSLATNNNNNNYWWMRDSENSPFKAAADFYRNCNEKNNCPSAVNNNNIPSSPQPFQQQPEKQQSVNIKNNPFLNGQFDSSNANVKLNDNQQFDISKNPFLNGNNAKIAGNGQPIDNEAENEKNGFLGVQPVQPFSKPGFATTHPLKKTIECRGGAACVAKHLCIDGVINKNGEGLIQLRSDLQFCTQDQVCCKHPNQQQQSNKLQLNLPNLNEITAGKSSIPQSGIKFQGGLGLSPGFIQVLPADGENGLKPEISHASGQSSTIKTPRDVSSASGGRNQVFSSTVDYSDVKFDSSARVSDFQGPAYLPPVAPSSPRPVQTRPPPPAPRPPAPRPPAPRPSYQIPVVVSQPDTNQQYIPPRPAAPSTTFRPAYSPSSTLQTFAPTTNREYLPPSPQPTRPQTQYVPVKPLPTTPSRPIYQPAPSTPKPFQTQPPFRPQPTQQSPRQPLPTSPQTYLPPAQPQPTTTPRPYRPPVQQTTQFVPRPSPSYPQPSQTYPQPSPTYPKPSPTYPKPSPTYPQPSPSYPRPSPTYPQPSPTYPQPTPRPTTLAPARPTPGGYDYPKPTPSFDLPTPQPPSAGSDVANQYVRPPPKKVDNGYLPPAGPNFDSEGSSNFDTRVKPTQPPRPPTSPPVRNPGDAYPDQTSVNGQFLRPKQPQPDAQGPPTACAAALKCVQEIYCSADGVISPVPVVLTKEQELARVPTTECVDLENGNVGKCCRDPNYVDPWPSANLVNGFDDGQYKEDANLGQYSQGLNRNVRSNTNNAGPNAISNSQQQPTCGTRNLDSTPKGQSELDVNFAEIPWQAMVLRDSNRSLLCGGAIIARDAVLTAAHCVEGLETSDVLIKGGEWKLGIDEEPLPFQIVKVAAILKHPQYKSGELVNDLAVLVLEEKLRLSKNIGTICLPQPNQIPTENCIATGWGKRILQLHAKGALMHSIAVNIMDNAQCQQTLTERFEKSLANFSPNTLCGYSAIDQCKVDYGSALACSNGQNQYTLSGIYAWDTGCKEQGQIGGYVAPDVEWIQSVLAKPLKELRAIDRQRQ